MSALSRRAAVTSLFALAALAGARLASADISGAEPPANRDQGLKRLLTPEDRAINRRCIDKTMNGAPAGKSWTWRNPRSGNGGSVTPTSKPERRGGQVCRSFEETITLKDGRTETVSGRACRKPDGSWSIVA